MKPHDYSKHKLTRSAASTSARHAGRPMERNERVVAPLILCSQGDSPTLGIGHTALRLSALGPVAADQADQSQRQEHDGRQFRYPVQPSLLVAGQAVPFNQISSKLGQ